MRIPGSISGFYVSRSGVGWTACNVWLEKRFLTGFFNWIGDRSSEDAFPEWDSTES